MLLQRLGLELSLEGDGNPSIKRQKGGSNV